MVNVGICGVYGEGDGFAGGQPVKVKTMMKMFSDNVGSDHVFTANTFNWKKNVLRLLKEVFCIARKCDIIIILPAHNGVKIFVPLFLFLKIFFRYKLVYSVIGGWLPELTKRNRPLKKCLQKVDYIFVETSRMQTDLRKQGFPNIWVVNNAKYLSPSILEKEVNSPIKLCYFSRVVKEKGVEDAVYSIIEANEKLGNISFSMDIYGPVDEKYKNEFDKLKNIFPSYITYKGVAKPEDSVQILNNYDLQIFPTRFPTEGIPGSIIDSYAAGIPVISSRWNSFDDVIIDGVTGFGYEQNNVEDLKKCLMNVYNKRDMIKNMREKCIGTFLNKYTPQSVFNEIERIIQ